MLTYKVPLFESDEENIDYSFENGQLHLIGLYVYPSTMGEKNAQKAADKLIAPFTQRYGRDYTKYPESYYWDLPDKQVTMHPLSGYIKCYLSPA